MLGSTEFLRIDPIESFATRPTRQGASRTRTSGSISRPRNGPESPLVVDQAVLQRGLQLTTSARGLVVLVHPDAASQRNSGHRFIADVLHANGLATLGVALYPPDEQLRGLPPPGMVQMKHRIRALFDWLSTQPSVADKPLALLGVDDAVRGCVAAAARHRPHALQALVLLDGRPYQVPHLLARLSLPTLLVIGQCDLRTLKRHRAAIRQMSAPAQLQLLAGPTKPVAAPGVHQAFALAAVGWLAQTLGHADRANAASRSGS